MTTLRECADTAAAALVEILRSAKGAVDAASVSKIIEQVLKQATNSADWRSIFSPGVEGGGIHGRFRDDIQSQ